MKRNVIWKNLNSISLLIYINVYILIKSICWEKDSLPPTILPLNFSLSYNNISKLSQLKVKIQDEFSGISKYKATINGKWILMEYEPKEDLLFFDLSDIFPITESELLFRLQVWDNVGNVQEIEIPLVIN